jgi:hypothetical protein
VLVKDLLSGTPVHLGSVASIALEQLLNEPLNVMDDWSRAEQLLKKGLSEVPESLELRVALYKMLAYSNRFDESLRHIYAVFQQVSITRGLPTNWHDLVPEPDFWSQPEPDLRLYLYSLKAAGFVLLRQQKISESMAILDKLQQLDSQDLVGGEVVRQMAQRLLDEELCP